MDPLFHLDYASVTTAVVKLSSLAEWRFRGLWERTQQKLADAIGKSQDWVHKQLRLARFFDYASVKAMALNSDLTERRFRGLWERTQQKLADATHA
jgi:hypothetical protein